MIDKCAFQTWFRLQLCSADSNMVYISVHYYITTVYISSALADTTESEVSCSKTLVCYPIIWHHRSSETRQTCKFHTFLLQPCHWFINVITCLIQAFIIWLVTYYLPFPISGLLLRDSKVKAPLSLKWWNFFHEVDILCSSGNVTFIISV